MRKSRCAARAILLTASFLGAAALSGQTVDVGIPFSSGATVPVTVTGIGTFVNVAHPANLPGDVDRATFEWSAAPCPAAVKIKFFRPLRVPAPTGGPPATFLAERGPFDVASQSPQPGLPPASAFVAVSVALVPPVPLQTGDLVAITNLTSCGGPILAADEGPAAVSLSGDVHSDFFPGFSARLPAAVLVAASGSSSALGLLNDRFAVTLSATDPRTGITTSGYPVKQGNFAGYFGLPELTGDATLPEVTVKMLDATGSPALGGSFWFFYAPLTDVEFALTVRDQSDGGERTYGSSGAGGGGLLCGAADTSAFGP